MTATEELRRMLDERGIEHDDYDPDPRYSRPTSDRKTEWDGASFREWPNGTIRFGAKGTTPAQAIAATVGNVGYGICFAPTFDRPPETMVGETAFDSEGNAIGWITNATVGRETLTAEQVRECAKGVYFEGYSDGATHRVNGIDETDWQTIADKLNATVGAGTCHITVKDNLDESEGLGDVWLECDECHWQMMLEPSTPRFKFCPNCGRRIEGE